MMAENTKRRLLSLRRRTARAHWEQGQLQEAVRRKRDNGEAPTYEELLALEKVNRTVVAIDREFFAFIDEVTANVRIIDLELVG